MDTDIIEHQVTMRARQGGKQKLLNEHAAELLATGWIELPARGPGVRLFSEPEADRG